MANADNSQAVPDNSWGLRRLLQANPVATPEERQELIKSFYLNYGKQNGGSNPMFPGGLVPGAPLVIPEYVRNPGPAGFEKLGTITDKKHNVSHTIQDVETIDGPDGVPEVSKINYLSADGTPMSWDMKTNKMGINPIVKQEWGKPNPKTGNPRLPLNMQQEQTDRNPFKHPVKYVSELLMGPNEETVSDQTLPYSSKWTPEENKSFQQTGRVPAGRDARDLNGTGYQPWVNKSTLNPQEDATIKNNGIIDTMWDSPFNPIGLAHKAINLPADIVHNGTPLNPIPSDDWEFLGGQPMSEQKPAYMTNANGQAYQTAPESHTLLTPFKGSKDDSAMGTAGRGLGNVAVATGQMAGGLGDFLTSPLGAATVATGGLAAPAAASAVGGVEGLAAARMTLAAATTPAEIAAAQTALTTAASASRAANVISGVNQALQVPLQGKFAWDMGHGAWDAGKTALNQITGNVPVYNKAGAGYENRGTADWPAALHEGANAAMNAAFAGQIGAHTVGAAGNAINPGKMATNGAIQNALTLPPQEQFNQKGSNIGDYLGLNPDSRRRIYQASDPNADVSINMDPTYRVSRDPDEEPSLLRPISRPEDITKGQDPDAYRRARAILRQQPDPQYKQFEEVAQRIANEPVDKNNLMAGPTGRARGRGVELDPKAAAEVAQRAALGLKPGEPLPAGIPGSSATDKSEAEKAASTGPDIVPKTAVITDREYDVINAVRLETDFLNDTDRTAVLEGEAVIDPRNIDAPEFAAAKAQGMITPFKKANGVQYWKYTEKGLGLLEQQMEMDGHEINWKGKDAEAAPVAEPVATAPPERNVLPVDVIKNLRPFNEYTKVLQQQLSDIVESGELESKKASVKKEALARSNAIRAKLKEIASNPDAENKGTVSEPAAAPASVADVVAPAEPVKKPKVKPAAPLEPVVEPAKAPIVEPVQAAAPLIDTSAVEAVVPPQPKVNMSGPTARGGPDAPRQRGERGVRTGAWQDDGSQTAPQTRAPTPSGPNRVRTLAKPQFNARGTPILSARQMFDKNNGQLSRLTYSHLKDLHEETVADPNHNPKFAERIKDEMSNRENRFKDAYSTEQEGRNLISGDPVETMTDAQLKDVVDNGQARIKAQREVVAGHNRGDYRKEVRERSQEGKDAIRELNRLEYQWKFAKQEQNKRVRVNAGIARPDGSRIVASKERQMMQMRVDPVTGEQKTAPAEKRNPVEALNHARGRFDRLSLDELIAAEGELRKQGRPYADKVSEAIQARLKEGDAVHRRLHGKDADNIPNPRTASREQLEARIPDLRSEVARLDKEATDQRKAGNAVDPQTAKSLAEARGDLSGFEKELATRDTLEKADIRYDASKGNFKQTSGDIQGTGTLPKGNGYVPQPKAPRPEKAPPIEGRDKPVIQAEGAAAYEAEQRAAAARANPNPLGLEGQGRDSSPLKNGELSARETNFRDMTDEQLANHHRDMEDRQDGATHHGWPVDRTAQSHMDAAVREMRRRSGIKDPAEALRSFEDRLDTHGFNKDLGLEGQGRDSTKSHQLSSEELKLVERLRNRETPQVKQPGRWDNQGKSPLEAAKEDLQRTTDRFNEADAAVKASEGKRGYAHPDLVSVSVTTFKSMKRAKERLEALSKSQNPLGLDGEGRNSARGTINLDETTRQRNKAARDRFVANEAVYMRLTESQRKLVDRISRGGATVGDILKQVVDSAKADKGLTSNMTKMAELLLKNSDGKSLDKLVEVNKDRFLQESYYEGSSIAGLARITGDKSPQKLSGHVSLSQLHLSDPKDMMRVVMHEFIHATTSDKVNRAIFGRSSIGSFKNDVFGQSGQKYMDRLRAYVRDPSSDKSIVKVTQAYLKYLSTLETKGELDTRPITAESLESARNAETGEAWKSNLVGQGIETGNQVYNGQYKISNLHEFMAAAMTEPEFQKELKGIKMGNANAWGKFKDAIAEIMGISPADSALRHTFDGVMEISVKDLSEFKRSGESHARSIAEVRAERFQREGMSTEDAQRRAIQEVRPDMEDGFGFGKQNDKDLRTAADLTADSDAVRAEERQKANSPDMRGYWDRQDRDKQHIDDLNQHEGDFVKSLKEHPLYDEALRNVENDSGNKMDEQDTHDAVGAEIRRLEGIDEGNYDAKRTGSDRKQFYEKSRRSEQSLSDELQKARDAWEEKSGHHATQDKYEQFQKEWEAQPDEFKAQVDFEAYTAQEAWLLEQENSDNPAQLREDLKREIANKYKIDPATMLDNQENNPLLLGDGEKDAEKPNKDITGPMTEEDWDGFEQSYDGSKREGGANFEPNSQKGAKVLEGYLHELRTFEGKTHEQMMRNPEVAHVLNNIENFTKASKEDVVNAIRGIGEKGDEIVRQLERGDINLKEATELAKNADTYTYLRELGDIRDKRKQLFKSLQRQNGNLRRISDSDARRSNTHAARESKDNLGLEGQGRDSSKLSKFARKEAQATVNRARETVNVIKKFTPETKLEARHLAADILTVSFLDSGQAHLDKLADRHPMPSDPIRKINDLLIGGRAGDMTRAVKNGFHTRVKTENNIAHNKLNRAIKPLEERLENMSLEEQQGLLEEVGRAVVSKTPHADAEIAQAAQNVRDLYRDLYYLQKNAGIDFGSAGPNYMPRLLNHEVVLNDRQGFVNAASKAYETTGLDPVDARDAANTWWESIQRGDEGFSYSENGQDFKFDAAANSGEPAHTRHRVFHDIGEGFMEKYYNRNVIDATRQYIGRAVKAAIMSEKFGAKFEKYKDFQQQIIDQGPKGDGLLRDVNDTVRGQLAPMRIGNPVLAGIHDAAAVYQSTRFLSRAVISSLGEPIIGAMRTGQVTDALTMFHGSVVQAYRNARHMGPDYHTRLAEDIGAVQSILSDSAITSSVDSRMIDTVSNGLSRRLQTQFFRTSGLHQWTEGTRVASIKLGERFIRRLALDIDAGGRSRELSARYLTELGVDSADHAGFSKFIKKLETLNETDRLSAITGSQGSKHAAAYRDALVRFGEQVIMDPNRGTRARLANHPLGGMVLGLQSYLYAFNENVVKRTMKTTAAAVFNSDKNNMSASNRMMLLAPLAIAPVFAAFQHGQGEFRDEFMSDPSRANDEPMSWGNKMMRTLSRAAFLGRHDFLANIFGGFKYDKDPATMVAGPVLGDASTFVKNQIGLYKDSNSPNTNTAERRAARSGYDSGVAPAAGILASQLPGVIGRIAGAGMIYAANHPAAREWAVDKVAGPPVVQKKQTQKQKDSKKNFLDMLREGQQ